MSKKNYSLGIDVGSTTSKCVILADGQDILGKALVGKGAGTDGVDKSVSLALEEAGLSLDDIDFIVATGYGRNSYTRADKSMSELSCHAKGGARIFEGVRTIIDIGGQDAKVLRLDEFGQMENFVMNDKCAAGTGRFLEVMSNVLHVPLDDFGEYDAQAKDAASVSSTCTVFAESEVISLLAHNEDVKNIIKGIHSSVASRVSGQVRRVGVKPVVAMTGGVSRNMGVVRALEAELEVDIQVSPDSQLAGALGAAIYAYENFLKKEN
ncbi:MAG: acyl-CoA dehydratase activase [Gallibacter sp.]|nr:acyl-CoA dehydratase activase [Gallibacter sp.]